VMTARRKQRGMTGEGPIAADAYDELADSYAEEVRESPYNAHMEFPATTSLLPAVAGERVLDAGCGTGVYTEWLLDQGAEVVGVDASEAMLAHAREQTGDRATFHQADLGKQLDVLEADAFDGVVSPLALGYVADWRQPVGEIINPLLETGFRLERLLEPQPTEAFRQAWPERYEKESRYPVFVCVRATLPE
jgi:SAM-dependent methyltransferase